MKCPLCGKRKGKRFCPAKNGAICTQCCGEKRIVEIACPSDCEHLKAGQDFHTAKHYVALLKDERDPARQKTLYRALLETPLLLSHIEEVIVGYAATLKSLSDQEVMEAAESLRKSYETEERGVIFEHSSANPIVQSLTREMRQFVEGLRQSDEAREHPRPSLGNIIDCLTTIELNAQFHARQNEGERAYLRFVTLRHPEAAAKPKGGILLP